MLHPEPALGGTVTTFTKGSARLVIERSGSGPDTFLVVHGLGMGRSVFADLVTRLPGTVHAVDLPGFGEAPEPDAPLEMPQHADLLAAWLTESGVAPVTVIGHSMGSQIAAELAVRHPRSVRAVVLAAPTVDAAARRVVRHALRFLLDTASIDPRVILRGAREYLRAGPHLIRKIRATVAHHPERIYPRITVPTLIMRGEHDPVSPAHWCRAVAEAIPHAEFTELAGSGHETLIRDAGPAAERIQRFLDDVRSGL